MAKDYLQRLWSYLSVVFFEESKSPRDPVANLRRRFMPSSGLSHEHVHLGLRASPTAACTRIMAAHA
eukprot:891366-Amphidinium_carterae.1